MKRRTEYAIDPITGRDLTDHRDLPYIVEQTDQGEVTVYFESEETKQQYFNTPPEDPVRGFKRDIGNSGAHWVEKD